jgi:MFS family permease
MAKDKKTPKLPVQQLAILSICRLAEPVALSSVFPYLPEMIESFNVPKNDVGIWTGFIGAAFSLSQCLTGIAWGRASDRYGRKPVILCGLTVTMVASLLFGFSQSLIWALVARSIAGASSGTVGIIRTTVAEMVPEKVLQPLAFSIMPLVWTIGSVLGPALGGALARPTVKYPQIFAGNEFLEKFPFMLPNVISCIFFLIGISSGLLFLKETLETKKHRKDYGRVVGRSLVGLFQKKRPAIALKGDQEVGLNRSGQPTTKKPFNDSPPGYREVFSKQSNYNLLAYCLMAFHNTAHDQLIPVFLSRPYQEKWQSDPNVQLPFKFAFGFSLESGRIGLLFTIYGIVGMFFQFLVFPPIARKYGILNCLRVTTLCFPIAYFLIPFTVLLPTNATRQVAIFSIMLIKNVGTIFAFPCCTILLTNSARSLRLLGTLNGVATSLSAIARAAGPTLGGATFTYGMKTGYVILPWFLLSLWGILAHLSTWFLVEMEGFGGTGDDDTGSDKEGNDNPERHSTALKSGTVDAHSDGPYDMAGGEEDDDDDFAIAENAPLMVQERLSRSMGGGKHLTPSDAGSERRTTSPIGMRESVGPGGGRKLSNGLGATMTGTSFH